MQIETAQQICFDVFPNDAAGQIAASQRAQSLERRMNLSVTVFAAQGSMLWQNHLPSVTTPNEKVQRGDGVLLVMAWQ